jgi:hypothetical protein
MGNRDKAIAEYKELLKQTATVGTAPESS